MFPVQIQWEFASAVPFSSAADGVSAVDGIAPTARIRGIGSHFHPSGK